LIKDDRLPRSKWKLGEVKELMKGRERETRGAVLRTATKKGPHTILRRPVQRLCPLEVNSNAVIANRRNYLKKRTKELNYRNHLDERQLLKQILFADFLTDADAMVKGECR
jgi:CHAT domain-containing protein